MVVAMVMETMADTDMLMAMVVPMGMAVVTDMAMATGAVVDMAMLVDIWAITILTLMMSV
jgi:hypothetical protein